MSKTNFRKTVYCIFRELFFFAGICLLLLLIIEDLRPGFVSFWFDIKIILFISLISGLACLFTSKGKNDKMSK